MTFPEIALIKEDLVAHAANHARDRELFYYKLILILLFHVGPEDLQSACNAALDGISFKHSYYEA